jgi:pimeloyl-ACP methyl ester carboxylesterase
LDNARLRLRDWPGVRGPLVHVPDPFVASSFVDRVAAATAPGYRVLSLAARRGVAYQVSAADLVGTLDQFGFLTPILIGEGLGCLVTLIVAAWYAERVRGLVLVGATYTAPAETVEGRALRDCPPDIASLRQAVRCPVLEATLP